MKMRATEVNNGSYSVALMVEGSASAPVHVGERAARRVVADEEVAPVRELIDRPFQVVFAANKVADVRLHESITGRRTVVSGQFRSKIQQVVDAAGGRQGPLPFHTQSVHVGQAIDASQITRHAVELAEQGRSFARA